MSRQSLNWIFKQLEQYSKTKGNFFISSSAEYRRELAGGEYPKSNAIFVLLPQILQVKFNYFSLNILPLLKNEVKIIKKVWLLEIISV